MDRNDDLRKSRWTVTMIIGLIISVSTVLLIKIMIVSIDIAKIFTSMIIMNMFLKFEISTGYFFDLIADSDDESHRTI